METLCADVGRDHIRRGVGGRIHRPLDGIGNRSGAGSCRLGVQRVDAALHALVQRRDADGGSRQPRPRRLGRV